MYMPLKLRRGVAALHVTPVYLGGAVGSEIMLRLYLPAGRTSHRLVEWPLLRMLCWPVPGVRVASATCSPWKKP